MHAKAHFSHSPVGHCADRIRWSWRQAKEGATDQEEPSTAREEEVTYFSSIVHHGISQEERCNERLRHQEWLQV